MKGGFFIFKIIKRDLPMLVEFKRKYHWISFSEQDF